MWDLQGSRDVQPGFCNAFQLLVIELVSHACFMGTRVPKGWIWVFSADWVHAAH